MIKLLCLALVACSSASATTQDATQPNRVCSIAHEIEPGGTCEDIGRAVGPNHADVAMWKSEGGVKWCIETFDAKQPLSCAPLKLSPKEQAEQTLAQERAKQAAAQPSPTTAAPVLPLAHTTIPMGEKGASTP